MLALLITGNQSPGNAPAQGNDMNTSVELSVNGKRTQTKQDAPGFARRSFIKRLAIGGASILPLGIALADSNGSSDGQGKKLTGSISKNDAAILRFLAAAEIIETDLWQQYNELAGPDGPYRDALEAIDDEMPEYIDQNTADEFSHQDFLNAFLVKMHRDPVNLESFRTLPPSPASPNPAPRLTNLMHLNVDTSWYLRYRSAGNPDFGDTFDQVVNIVDRPGIPTQDPGLYTAAQIQAIANTAAFHFAMIEQGGSSLYAALSLKARSLLALRILASIGGSEVVHFSIWHDSVGNIPAVNSGDGLVFPDLEANEDTDPALVMPKPCKFISDDLPPCSIIRPTSLPLAGATATIQFLKDTGLFAGQSGEFLDFLFALARDADGASAHL